MQRPVAPSIVKAVGGAVAALAAAAGRSRTAIFDLFHLAKMHAEHGITGAFVSTAAHGRFVEHRDGDWLLRAAQVEASP